MTELDRYFGLSDKVVMLTGATKGIGRAMVDVFAHAGASLVLASNESEANVALAAELRSRGVPAITVTCDVTSCADLTHLVDAAFNRFGGIDVLICNAGIPGPFGPMARGTGQEFESLLDVNLRHPLHLTNLVAPHIALRGGGSILLTASIAGLRGNKSIGLYALTKAALAQLARNLAVEWGPDNIRANAIAPGLIMTEWAGLILANPTVSQRRLALTPLRRAGHPWEVAAAALFLASPAGGFITGHTLVVDGGTTISDGN